MQEVVLGTLPTVYGAMRVALFSPLVSGGVRLGKFGIDFPGTLLSSRL